jgi:hypothetical protein
MFKTMKSLHLIGNTGTIGINRTTAKDEERPVVVAINSSLEDGGKVPPL